MAFYVPENQKRRSYESKKKMIKYSALGLVAVLATSALVACSSGKSASGRKPLKLGRLEQPNPSLMKKKDGKLTGYEIEVLREIF